MLDAYNKLIHPGYSLLLAVCAALLLAACATTPLPGTGNAGPTTTAPDQTGSTRGPGTSPAPATTDEPLGAGPIVLAVPLSGQLAMAGEAIRAGFNGARDNSDTKRRVSVVDSSSMSADAIVATAREQQAALLVGPLNKDKVNALAQLAPNVPVLALNQLDGTQAPPLFYRYALAPEDDAHTAAKHAAANGWRDALVLVPQGDWGNRVLSAFRDAFDKQDGSIVDAARFDPKVIDHKNAVRSVLSRYHQGTPVDFVFIAARPEHARMLRSQLRFYHAATLPVIGTSDIYSGTPAPRQDEDLNGVGFAILPWVLSPNPRVQALRNQALEHGSTATRRFPQLYAMGIDAWRLSKRWLNTGLPAGTQLPGLTGALQVMPNGRIRRRLAWARFDHGVARLEQAVEPATMAPDQQGTDANWPTSAASDAAGAGSAASLDSQVWTNTTRMPYFEQTSPADTAAPAAQIEQPQQPEQPGQSTTPQQSHNNSDREQRAAEVSRLLDMSDADPATTTDGATPAAAGDASN